MFKRSYRLELSKYEQVASRLGYGISRTLSPAVQGLEPRWFECTVETDEVAVFIEDLGGERIADE